MIDSWDSTAKLLASVFSDTDGTRDQGISENKTDISTDSDQDQASCLRDSKTSWLDKWWEASHSNVKSRVFSKQQRSNRVRCRSKQIVTSISLEEYVASENSPKDVYVVSLNAPHGVGMNLFVSYEGLVLVQGLYKLRNGMNSPAQNCGVISVGDQLVQLNDINIEALSFYETTDLLKDLDLLAKDRVITMGFRYMDAPPVLLDEPDEVYEDVVDVESEGDSEDEDESHLNLVPLSLGQHPSTTTNEIIPPTPPTDTIKKVKHNTSAHKAQMEQYLQREKEDQQQREDRQLQHTNTKDAVSLRQSPMVEDAFLALFAMDTPVSASQSHAKQGPVLCGMFNSFNEKAVKRRPDPTPFTSELDTVQYNIRKRHLYPTAARVSCIANVTHEAQVLQDLAEEIYEWRPLHYCQQYAGFYSPRAADDVGTEHSAVLSALIATPQDRARYKYTEHLEWDDARQCYVQRAPPSEQSLLTYVDCAVPMHGVLLNLELEARRALPIDSFSLHPAQLMPTRESQDTLCSSAKSAGNASDNDSSDKLAGFLNTREQTSPRTPRHKRKHTIHGRYVKEETATSLLQESEDVEEEVEKVQAVVGAGRSSIRLYGCGMATGRGDGVSQHKLSVKLVPYVANNSHSQAKQPFYYLKQDQLITAEHTSVQRLLAQPSSDLLSALSAAVDAEIENMTSVSEHNPFHNAKHYESGLEISIPPMLLTYQILYTAQHLKPLLLQSQAFLTVIERWAATFDPKGLNQALKTQFSRKHKPSKKPHKNNASPMSSPRSSFEPARKQEFLVFFNNDLQTTRDLLPFIDVVSELLTFLLLSRMSPEILCVGTRRLTLDEGDQNVMGRTFRSMSLSVELRESSSSVSTSFTTTSSALYPDVVAASCARKFGLLLFLDSVAMAASSARYGGTLQAVLDLASAEASHAPRADLLQTLLSQSVGTMLSAQQLIDKLASLPGASETREKKPSLLLCLLLQHLSDLFAQNTQLALDLTTLLYPQISPWNVQQALFPPDEPEEYGNDEADGREFADIPHVSAVSSITPSPVSSPRHSLLPVPAFPSQLEAAAGDVRMSLQTARDLDRILTRTSSNQSVLTVDSNSTQGRISKASRETQVRAARPRGGLCAQNSFYSYLTRLFRNRTELCTTRPDLVLSWLETALSLAQQDGAASLDFQPFQSAFATPRGKKKNPFCITVRNILHSPDQYSLPVLAAMQLCAAYEHFEGAALLGVRLKCNNEGLVLPPADLAVVLSVLPQIIGGQIAQMLALVGHLHSIESVGDINRGTHELHLTNASYLHCSPSSSRDSVPADHLPSLCSTATALLRLLTSAVRALCCSGGSTTQPTPARRFESPEWQVFGEIFNQIVHEKFYERPTTSSGEMFDRSILCMVSNLLGECLRFAVGTENALLVLQNTPVLNDLI